MPTVLSEAWLFPNWTSDSLRPESASMESLTFPLISGSHVEIYCRSPQSLNSACERPQLLPENFDSAVTQITQFSGLSFPDEGWEIALRSWVSGFSLFSPVYTMTKSFLNSFLFFFFSCERHTLPPSCSLTTSLEVSVYQTHCLCSELSQLTAFPISPLLTKHHIL